MERELAAKAGLVSKPEAHGNGACVAWPKDVRLPCVEHIHDIDHHRRHLLLALGAERLALAFARRQHEVLLASADGGAGGVPHPQHQARRAALNGDGGPAK